MLTVTPKDHEALEAVAAAFRDNPPESLGIVALFGRAEDALRGLLDDAKVEPPSESREAVTSDSPLS